ncbi:hypothetical protein CB0940_03753 [Cercospora beticola]|uniref:Alcohol acetyltransferase FCK4 n=1 Tax=Cercospora beticola TaxID=122368 RepID=A0A2G5I1Y2_CERBT|nr:hypothetical protein CB0940_03753 [Cercospora beticola]PIA98758.1 hypothetical protein CB0940_03753 [Cercospora beticola]WPB00949.1 hypothetical protein RHO25_005569 [Cercospora beticola]
MTNDLISTPCSVQAPKYQSIGLNEKRCIVREYLSLYNNIITIGTYSGPSQITSATAIKALKRCTIQHPALSTTIRYQPTEKFELVRPAKVDISQHLQIVDDIGEGNAFLQNILDRLHNDPIVEDDSIPQWKAVVVRLETGFHLAFSCSHGLADGRSGQAFHATFLETLQNLSSYDQDIDEDTILPTTKQWNPVPPMEKVGNLTISWKFLLGPLANEYFPKAVTRFLGLAEEQVEDLWLGAKEKPALPEEGELLATGVRVVSVSAEVLELVLARARMHDAKLTGLVSFLIARALARSLQRREQNYSSFLAALPIDMRRALGKGQGQIANYVSNIVETVTIPSARISDQDLSDFEWLQVRNTTARLLTASGTLADQPVGLLKYLMNFREYTLKKAKAPATESFEVSNAGVFNGIRPAESMSSQWRVDQMLFSQSANAGGPPLNYNLASAKGGDLTITATWWREMLGVRDEDAFVQEVCDAVVADMDHLGSC